MNKMPLITTDRLRGLSLINEIEAHAIYSTAGDSDAFKAIWHGINIK